MVFTGINLYSPMAIEWPSALQASLSGQQGWQRLWRLCETTADLSAGRHEAAKLFPFCDFLCLFVANLR
jgi:hypothetical protein